MKQLLKGMFRFSGRMLRKNYGFIFLFWLSNLLFALVLSLPVFALLDEMLRHSAVNNALVESFDYIWFEQFINLYRNPITTFPFLVFTLLFIYMMIHLFFSGGILAVFCNPEKNHAVDFFYGGVKYVYRFFKIFSIAVIFYALGLTVSGILDRIIRVASPSVAGFDLEFPLQITRYLLFVVYLCAVTIVTDYYKVYVVSADRGVSLASTRDVLRFIRKNYIPVFTFFFLAASTVLAAGLLYMVVDGLIPKRPFYMLFLIFFIQQGLIIFRLLIRMLFYSSEVFLYSENSAETVPAHIVEFQPGV